MKSYHLSNAQKRMYFLDKSGTARTTYNILYYLEIKQEVNIDHLWLAFDEVINRHETFRTSFEEDKETGEIIQVVHSQISYVKEFEKIKEADFDEKLKTFVTPFALEKAPLFRVKIFKKGNIYVFALNIHHIIFDGFSAFIFNSELTKLYKNENLSGLKYQYSDYVSWQEKFKEFDEFRDQEKYWLKKVSSDLPKLELPLDYKRENESSHQGDTLTFCIKEETLAEIKEIRNELKSTYYTICLTAFVILLSKYTGEDDVIVGIPVSGRNYLSRRLIGFFVNTLPLINKITKDKTVRAIIHEIGFEVKSIIKNQDYQLDDLVNKLNLERERNRNILFDAFFNLVKLEPVDSFIPKSVNLTKEVQFDLAFQGYDESDRIIFEIQYKVGLFKKQTIKQLASHYENILRSISKNIDQKIGDIDYLTNEEKHSLLHEFNNTAAFYSKDKTIVDLFEEAAQKYPDKTAVVFNKTKLTYRELNEKANQVAHLLRKEYREHWNIDIKGDSLIGIYIDYNLEMIVGILGILKSGAAYVPFDKSDPEERLKLKINDSKCKLIITSSTCIDNLLYLGEFDFLPVSMDYYWGEIEKESAQNPVRNNSSSNLAYVIYTSGSTGKPKGVMLEHRALVNQCIWHNKEYNVTKIDKMSQIVNIAFDISVSEIFASLIAGAELHVIDKNLRIDLEELNNYFNENGITIAHFPTKMFETFIDYENYSLSRLITAGEKLVKWKRKPYQIINGYGPTETNYATFFVVDKNYDNIPIGKPLDNYKIYILDESLKLCPLNVPGEIYIAGDGVARGYLHMENLTNERFIHLQGEINERAYKTSDLGKWLPDGNIEILGRKDNQVKINGMRIELDEISYNLLKIDGIKEAVVTVEEYENTEKFLCAYFVGSKNITEDIMRETLSKLLPKYMIPHFLIHLEKFPLNANGKLDKKKLPKPIIKDTIEDDINVKHSDYNNIRGNILSIWKDVLKVEGIKLYSNFFRIGGNSLVALILTKKLSERFRRDIPNSFIYQYPTINEQAVQLGKLSFSPYTDIIDLNNAHSDTLMLLVHPGGGGAEVYFKLAQMLKEKIHVIGINSYNINHPEKPTSDLTFIVDYYFEAIRTNVELNNKNIYIGGWSLGGNIAIELARKFSDLGIRIKNLIFFDTFNVHSIKEISINTNWREKFLRAQILHAGVPSELVDYVHNVNIMETEGLYKMKHSVYPYDALLFKAMGKRPYHELIDVSEGDEKEIDAQYQQSMSLVNNGWDMLIPKLITVGVPCHHGNIVSDEKCLSVIKESLISMN